MPDAEDAGYLTCPMCGVLSAGHAPESPIAALAVDLRDLLETADALGLAAITTDALRAVVDHYASVLPPGE